MSRKSSKKNKKLIEIKEKEEVKELEKIKNLDNVAPLDYVIKAEKHPPLYNMHRYFARRPANVFNLLIKHYSNPDSIILDPFCGGGPTIVEGLREGRNVIGVDFNPLATFVTTMEIEDIDLEKYQETFTKVESSVSEKILDLYKTTCPKCSEEVVSHWNGWHNKLKCDACNTIFLIKDAEKADLGRGRYKCPHCGKSCVARLTKIGEEMIGMHFSCKCGNDKKEPDKADMQKLSEIEKELEGLSNRYWYPKLEIPDGDNTRQILNWNYKYFYELFTKRNLLALTYLFHEIKKIKHDKIRRFMKFTFSQTLTDVTKLSSSVLRGWQAHAYWIPNEMYEVNVWERFTSRFKNVYEGKEYSNKIIGKNYKKATSFSELKKDKNCLILTKPSDRLPEIQNNSVDVIITDPPYGSNVNYSEMSDFWGVWLQDTISLEGLINTEKEAIVNRTQGKSQNEYRHLIYEVFKECHRILKPNRWMVMTFHNKDIGVWSSLHMAAHDAGFHVPDDGIIWQPPIKEYTETIFLKRHGSMLGDFIISFKRLDEKPQLKKIDDVEIGDKIRKFAKRAIEYHGGAKLSTIYSSSIIFLTQSGLLHKISQKSLLPYLKKEFIEKDGKWYTKERIDEKTGEIKPIDFIPVHQRIEFLITSFLNEVKKATLDDIIREVFMNLLNGDAADYEEIDEVLKRICEKETIKGESRPYYKLKKAGIQKRITETWEKEEREKAIQKTLTGEEIAQEQTKHDLVIEKLVKIGEKNGYKSHIGQTEQRKYRRFRKMSIPMGDKAGPVYGILNEVYDMIREIDVLWLSGNQIVEAFEVETSTSINSGIDRFRNLFVAQPVSTIKASVVVPQKRKDETIKKIGSLANVKEGLNKKISYIFVEDILKTKDKKIVSLKKKVII